MPLSLSSRNQVLKSIKIELPTMKKWGLFVEKNEVCHQCMKRNETDNSVGGY